MTSDISSSKLILHVGHAKTGRSALQAFLARNAPLLQEFGLNYPETENTGVAAKGRPTNGNFQAFPEKIDPQQRQLFSSEFFYPCLNDSFLEDLKNRDPHATIICFTRNYVELLISAWSQKVKVKGEPRSLSEFSKESQLYPNLLKTIERIEACGLNFRILNYSFHVEDLEATFIKEILGKDSEAFMKRAETFPHRVNRSLTAAECEFQRQFNRYFGRSAFQLISKPLLWQHPEIATGRMRFPKAELEAALALNVGNQQASSPRGTASAHHSGRVSFGGTRAARTSDHPRTNPHPCRLHLRETQNPFGADLYSSNGTRDS